MNAAAVPASAPASRDPHTSPKRKRREMFRAVAAVPASAPASRDPHTSPKRKRRDTGPLGETGLHGGRYPQPRGVPRLASRAFMNTATGMTGLGRSGSGRLERLEREFLEASPPGAFDSEGRRRKCAGRYSLGSPEHSQ